MPLPDRHKCHPVMVLLVLLVSACTPGPVPPSVSLLQIDSEDVLPELIKTQEISKQLVR